MQTQSKLVEKLELKSTTWRSNVCGKSRTALEVIKKTKGQGGMTKAQIQLAEEQMEDMAEMKQEIKAVKADIAELKTDVASINGKIDILIKQSENRPLLQIIKELVNTRGFWVVLALIVIGIYGIDISSIKNLFN